MSYPQIGVDGEVNPCYFLLREVEHCFHQQLYATTKCKPQRDDFFECHNRAKQVKLMTELNEQLRRAKVINVPRYDAAGDCFIFDDGRKVANNDPIFARFKWA